MSKFKVGDKVALTTSPHDYLGCIRSVDEDGVALVELPPRYVHAFIIKLDQLVPYQEIPDMTDDEIYNMLKPKMEKSGVLIDKNYIYTINPKAAIALAYRSGYLRAKKGRPFKIGGEKE